ncbi:MAG: glycosyl hydrolase [Luteolibacter sp.]
MKLRHKNLSHLSAENSANGRRCSNPSRFCSLTELARTFLRPLFISLVAGSLPVLAASPLAQEFLTPPDSARPGSYWYFLDGNLNQKEMKADLDDMKKSGLGSVLFLEVDLGIPRGPVKMMSDQWIDYVAWSMKYAEQLGMDYAIGTGPGWCAAGGPWVKPEDAMQHLVHSEVSVKGPTKFEAVLPLPKQYSTIFNNLASDFYEDVAVFAFPSRKPVIEEIIEKALYLRDPYTSYVIKPFLDPYHYNLQVDRSALLQQKDVVERPRHLENPSSVQKRRERFDRWRGTPCA